MWLLLVLVTLLSNYMVESCQPELVSDAASLVSVGYDRHRNTAVYVDTLSVKMKEKKKFSALLMSSCNGRRDATLKIEIRESGSEEWKEEVKDIRITAKHNDDIKNIDPCLKYEVRVSIMPTKSGELKSLPIFALGPYYDLEPEEIGISKFKGDGVQYYKEHFVSEYTEITDASFTLKWNPICAQGINLWIRAEEQDWENGIERKIINDIENPTTEVTFDVDQIKVFEVIVEFFLDSEMMEGQGFERTLEKVSTNPSKEILKTKFNQHSYNEISKVLSWDYTQIIEDLVCLESFSYKLLKDENGSTKELMDGSCHDKQREEFHIDCPTSDCGFQIRTEIKYETVGRQNDTLDGFRIQVTRKNEEDISVIEPNKTHIEDLAEIGSGDFEIPKVDFLE